MLQAIVKRRFTALIVGAILLVTGIVMLSTTEVTCGRRTMTESDVCEITKNGSTTSNTYTEQKNEDQQNGYIAVGIGILGLLVGGAGLALSARTRPRHP